MYNRLKENIKYLKLNRIDTLLDNYLERAVKENLSITECLTYLFEEERKSKADTALIMSTQMAGFPFKKTFEHFDFDFQPSIDKKTIDDLVNKPFLIQEIEALHRERLMLQNRFNAVNDRILKIERHIKKQSNEK